MFDRADEPDMVLKIGECPRNMRPLNSMMVTGAALMKYISILKHTKLNIVRWIMINVFIYCIPQQRLRHQRNVPLKCDTQPQRKYFSFCRF